MQNGADVWAFAGLVFLGTVVICTAVHLLECWLLRQDRPRLRRALRVHKVRRSRYEPPIPNWKKEYPDGRKESL